MTQVEKQRRIWHFEATKSILAECSARQTGEGFHHHFHTRWEDAKAIAKMIKGFADCHFESVSGTPDNGRVQSYRFTIVPK